MFGDAELDFGVLEYMQQRRMAFGLKNEGDQPANLELHLSSEDSASAKSWSVSVQQVGYNPDVHRYMSIFPLATMDCQCRQRHRWCRKMFLSVPPHVHWRIVLHFQPVNYELQPCLRHYQSTLSLSALAPSGAASSDLCVTLRSAVGYARLQIPSSLCSQQNEVISFSNVLYIPLRNAGSAPLHLLFRVHAEDPSNRLTVAATTDGDGDDGDGNRLLDRAPRLRLQTANCNIADSILSTASPSPTTFQTPHKGDYSHFARTDEASTEYQTAPARWQELRVPGGGRASLCVSAAAASAQSATPPVRGTLVLATRCACYVLHLEASATPLMQTTPGPLLHM